MWSSAHVDAVCCWTVEFGLIWVDGFCRSVCKLSSSEWCSLSSWHVAWADVTDSRITCVYPHCSVMKCVCVSESGQVMLSFSESSDASLLNTSDRNLHQHLLHPHVAWKYCYKPVSVDADVKTKTLVMNSWLRGFPLSCHTSHLSQFWSVFAKTTSVHENNWELRKWGDRDT